MADCPDHERRTSELEKNVAVIASTTKRMSDEMSLFIQEARVHSGDMRDRVVRLEAKDEEKEKQIKVLFQRAREITNDEIPNVMDAISTCRNATSVRMQEMNESFNKRVKPIEDQHLLERGGWKMLKDLRVGIPVAFSIVLGLLQVFHWIKPYLKGAP